MALQQRCFRAVQQFRRRLAQVVEKFRQLAVAPRRVGVHSLAQHVIDPGRQVAILAPQRAVAQAQLGGAAACTGHFGAVGQVAAQQAVGDHAQREQIRTHAAAFAEEILRCGVGQRAGHRVVRIHATFGQAGDLRRAEVDQLQGAAGVDQDVLRTQVAVQHFQAVKGAQPAGDLLQQVAHLLQRGLRMIGHPVGQRLALDVLRHAVQVLARPACRRRAHHMHAVHAAGDPFLEQQAFEIRTVVAQVQGRGLEHQPFAAVLVLGQVHMAAAAGMQFAQDAVAVEARRRLQQRRQGEFFELALDFPGLAVRQGIDAHQLGGEVVGAAPRVGFQHQAAGGGVQIVPVGIDQREQRRLAQPFVHAIGEQQEQVADLQGQGAVVDFQMRVDAQRPAQAALLRRQPDPVLLGERFQLAVAQPIDARIADMEQVRGGGLEHQRAEGADMAAVTVVAVRATPRLGMQPGVGSDQHALAGLLHRPGVRRAEVVFQKALHRRFAGDVADLAAADAIGDGQGDALAVLLLGLGQAQAVEVLVEGLAALVRELADGDGEGGGHGGFVDTGVWGEH